MGEDERQRRIRKEKELMKRAEEYLLCPLHNRRYPQGGVCPGCASDMKKQK
jgi:hypothetical protein